MSRIESFAKTLKNGSQSDEMMSLIELQLLQFKQMADELCDMLPKKSIDKPQSTISFEGVSKFSLK
jgi:hypothetical protein